ncbi:acyl carrier protein [uncultured Rhodospira sp.]|uniref:acyl carrier protein n=1 Tax=uncultured Rhodospira sp. TaxID=1936189 RepID=UPI00260E41E5|nr:acyl carrier protein [uncultured Rhodospira sp.]
MTYHASIKQFLLDEFARDMRPEEIEDDFDLIGNNVIDSLGLLKIVAWLENRYGISIDVMDTVPENFNSVTAINAYLERVIPTKVA